MSRLTLAQLEAFHWTATLGSVERAAKRLHLAQPTVSLRLKALEEAVGATLFDRSRRVIRLTPEGAEMLPEARRVLSGVARLSERAETPEVAGQIRIGFSEGVAMVCLSPVLEMLAQRYPKLQPEFMVSTSSELAGVLTRHDLDFALLVSPPAMPGFAQVAFGAQETGFIASTKWELPERVAPHDLADLPVIANRPDSINYRQTMSWFASAGLAPARLTICNSVAVLAHVVGTGAAIGIFPKLMAQEDILAGRSRALLTAPRFRDLPIYARFPEGGADHRIQAILATVRDVLDGMDYLHEEDRSTAAGVLLE